MNSADRLSKKLLGLKLSLVAFVTALLILAGCAGSNVSDNESSAETGSQATQSQTATNETSADTANDTEDDADEGIDEEAAGEDAGAGEGSSTNASESTDNASGSSTSIKNGVPAVLGGNWVSQSNGLYFTNDAEPDFSASLKKKKSSFEDYSSLDYLGRCGPALACIGLDIMPTGGRGSISEVKPTGWHTYNYDFVNGGYLYNRCHLVAYSLAGENANERNLITGTRQMNEAMIMFENIVYTYVTGSGNHCLYRVTPVFLGKELVARGVHMEAYSVEDGGKRIKFNVYLPNKQDKVKINYSTGESSLKSGTNSSSKSSNKSSSNKSSKSSKSSTSSSKQTSSTYVLNTSSKKFHYSHCSAVKKMADHNKSVVKDARSSIINMGYVPCKICNP